MTRTTRAVVFDGPHVPLTIADLPIPPPGPGEVLVRITATTLCGSDLASRTGRRAAPAPSVLGHESIGIVEAVGDGAVDVSGAVIRAGARITWSIAASCGACGPCRRGTTQKCEQLVKFGHERLGQVRGPAGGLATLVLLPPGTAIVPVPVALPDEVACPASCATATVAGAIRVAAIRSGEHVLVVGLGMLGLTACAMARETGAVVTGLDVAPNRVEMAGRFGAAHAALSGAGAADGEGPEDGSYDVLLEFSGNAAATTAGIAQLGLRGRAVLVGAVHPGPSLSIDAEHVVRHLIRIEGLHNYVAGDLRAAVAFLAARAHAYPFADLVTGAYPLDQAEAAFAAALRGEAPRVMVRPTAGAI